MFINYIKIQLIRYFKGSNEIPLAFAALVIILFALTSGAFAYYGVIKNNATILTGDNVGQVITADLSVGFMVQILIVIFGGYIGAPYIIGIFSCIYMCAFFRHRSYVNLDISMRNKTLYCLSEVIICIIAGFLLCLILALAVVIAGIIDPIPDGPAFYELCIGFGACFILIVEKVLAATFCSKLCRKSFSSILVFIISDIVLNVGSGLVAEFSKIAIFRYLLYSSPFVYMESSFFIGEETGNPDNEFYIAAAMMIIRCTLLFIASVFLFKRKYEEKKE